MGSCWKLLANSLWASQAWLNFGLCCYHSALVIIFWEIFLPGKYFSLGMYNIFYVVISLVGYKFRVTNLFTWPPKQSVEFKIYTNRVKLQMKNTSRNMLWWQWKNAFLIICSARIYHLFSGDKYFVYVMVVSWYLLSPSLIPLSTQGERDTPGGGIPSVKLVGRLCGFDPPFSRHWEKI